MTRRPIRWTPRGVIVAGIVGALLGLPVACAATPDEQAIPACVAEDGPAPCYWDADMRGNHEGRSFTLDRNNFIHYVKEVSR